MRWISSALFFGIHFVDALTIKVDGEGYLRFLRNGLLIYQKQADIKVNKGVLTNQGGDPLSPTIQVPKESSSFEIDLKGLVRVRSDPEPLGQLVIATCKGKKQALSKDVFKFKGPIKLGNPGEDEWGVIRMIHAKNSSPSGVKGAILPALEFVLDFKSEAEIEKDEFTLGDLVKNKLPPDLEKIVLGETPTFGPLRQVMRYQIESRMKLAGHNLNDFKCVFPAQIRVKRKSQSIFHEQICEVALEAAKSKLGEVKLAPGYQPTMSVPLGEVQLAVENLSGYKDTWTAVVGIYVNGQRFNGRKISILRSGIGSSMRIGSVVKVLLRSNGVLVETKGKLKGLREEGTRRYAQVEYNLDTLVEGVLRDDGSVEINL